ncbi:MAG: polysaccharide biosynthesis tyrosine autokinase [Jatrophihabitantaceae bacterium]
MNLRDYPRALHGGWATVLAFVIGGTAIGAGLTLNTTKVYEASVQIFVATSALTDPSHLSAGNTSTADRVQSYPSIASTPAVTHPVIQKLKLQLTEQALAAKITADASPHKDLVNLHVTDHDPQNAARLANEVAVQFDKVVQNTEQTDARGKPLVKLTVIRPATVPASPIEPRPIVNIGLGTLLGLLLGLGFVLVRVVLDNTVKGPEDFEPLGVPVLGHVPFDKQAQTSPIAFRADPHSARSESYRLLRTGLQVADPDDDPRIIAVTSAVRGEGRTTTAINLAAALAESGYRVCLVELDLGRPSLARALGLAGDTGLTTALIGRMPVAAVLQNAAANLAVLAAGPVPPNAGESLIAMHAKSIIDEVSARVDYTIIDTAPLLPGVDSAELTVLADATVLVHRAGRSRRIHARRSVDALARVGVKPAGVVLTMAGRGHDRYDAHRPARTKRPRQRTRAGSVNGSNGRPQAQQSEGSAVH